VTEAIPPAVADRRIVSAEDEARANFYALLSRLYADAPDAALLRALAGAEALTVAAERDGAVEFARAWDRLRAASRVTEPEAAASEYQELFVGVGKSEVSLHASAYVSRGAGSALADLRAALAELGLGRLDGVNVFEDHLSAVLETMRVLIAGASGVEPATLAQQRSFFADHVARWVSACCDAIRASPIANYYLRVAEFTQVFMAVERDSFAID
jgi:TorA maturation chaperone TorD